MKLLKDTFKEILTFNGNEGLSATSKIRIEIVSDKEAELSLALPLPNDPFIFVESGVCAAFLSCLLPHFEKAQGFIEFVSINHFGKGRTEDFLEATKEGDIRVRYNPTSLVYEFRIMLS